MHGPNEYQWREWKTIQGAEFKLEEAELILNWLVSLYSHRSEGSKAK